MIHAIFAIVTGILIIAIGVTLFVQSLTDEQREDWGHGPKDKADERQEA